MVDASIRGAERAKTDCSLPQALLTHIAAARAPARCRPPPAKDGKRDQKANARGDYKRPQTRVAARQCGIDCRCEDPKLRNVNHDEHDQPCLPYCRTTAPRALSPFKLIDVDAH